MKTEPQKEHQWLQQLVGEWTYEGEASMGPDKPPEKFQGTESVRSIGRTSAGMSRRSSIGSGAASPRRSARGSRCARPARFRLVEQLPDDRMLDLPVRDDRVEVLDDVRAASQ